MYVKLTTACNMRCPICVADAEYMRGRFMSKETFVKLLRWDNNRIIVGGGEPTMHPMLLDFVYLAADNGKKPWVTTNGKLVEETLKLLSLAKRGVTVVTLSLDAYHEPIHPKVVRAFEESDSPNVFIRETKEEHLIKRGRSQQGDPTPCSQPNGYVDVDGTVYRCGCPSSPVIGTVNDETLKTTEPCRGTAPNYPILRR